MTAYGIPKTETVETQELIQELCQLNTANLQLWNEIVTLIKTGWTQYRMISLHHNTLEFVTFKVKYLGLLDATPFINAFLDIKHKLCWDAITTDDGNPFNSRFSTGDYVCIESDIKNLLLLREEMIPKLHGKWKTALKENHARLSVTYCSLMDSVESHTQVASLFGLKGGKQRIHLIPKKFTTNAWNFCLYLSPEIDLQEVEAFAYLVEKNFTYNHLDM